MAGANKYISSGRRTSVKAGLCQIIVLMLAVTQALPAGTAGQIRFNRDVRPVLSDRCYVCHGPDVENRQADLRLDLEQDAKQSVIVAGKPDESELVRRILSNDPDVRMPPPGSKLELSPEEQAMLTAWIEQGATWDQHWAFVAPRQPMLPSVLTARWPRNEIDYFVLSNLEERSSTPSSEASRETLIRRISFDLTGLPPSLEQIDNFVTNESPDAWSEQIDRLLSSGHFGERMASVWLDLARYSDTFGYQVDRDRYVWPWRDWVIRAFNSNMPHHEFLRKQIAGDLLPDATDEDILATTFNRLHPQKVEGGSTPEEFRIEYVSDRTQTFATAFLGLTMECCRCHDHKYDPFSQKDYYQLTAFFDKIDEAGLYSYRTQSTPTPTLLMLDEADKRRIRRLRDSVKAAEKKLAETAAAADAEFRRWLAVDRSVEDSTMLPNRVLHMDFEAVPGGGNRHTDGKVGMGIRFSGDDAVGTQIGQFSRNQPFSIALWLNTPDHKERAVVWHHSLGWTDGGSRGYQLLIKDGRLHASLIHFWPGNAISIATADPLPVQEWHHVTVRYDGSSRAAGISILIDAQPVSTEIIRDNLYKEITADKRHLVIGERSRDRGFTNGMADELMVFERQLTPIEVAQLTDGHSLATALTTPHDQLSARQTERLFEYFLSTTHNGSRQQLAALTEARSELSAAVDGVQEIMVMKETDRPVTTHLLRRGAYDARGDVVTADTPAILPKRSADAPANRLGLADWLISPNHPLTARVAVNHYWQVMFGQGLVRTPEDFGSQGRPPTHPRLLDWLALDFIQHDWDVKRLLKQIAMSATYRQTSTMSEDHARRDPNNDWLGRFPSYRLPAEMLRDNALAVSGLLVDRMGGPPAKPYEVEVSFKPADRDSGPGLYRRSVYTYWKRTGPAPVMMVLDAVKRDVCRVNRERTASPLEAFVLMNGPQFVEASRVLAEQLLAEHHTPQQALPDLFRLLTSRPATDREHSVLTGLLAEQLDYFGQDAERTKKYLSVGDHTADTEPDPASLAALSAVANALLSYDECLIKR
ncbi:MAG: DUF1553 domain-containing protein [Fuerstiella sp.]|nr:DUF1553 domain-containing protein [Fuerstiella sp.]